MVVHIMRQPLVCQILTNINVGVRMIHQFCLVQVVLGLFVVGYTTIQFRFIQL